MVKPRDEASNKAEGPSREEIERIERILNENIQRPKLAGTGSNSLGSATRYVSCLLFFFKVRIQWDIFFNIKILFVQYFFQV